MITKIFKYFMAAVLESNGNNNTTGKWEVKNTQNQTRYLGFHIGYFPTNIYSTVSFATASPGIQVGTGNTAPTEDDFRLASQITSGMTATSPTMTRNLDNDGNPYLEFVFVLSNSTGNDITVSEVGYVQYLYSASSQGGMDSSLSAYMLDRTVLSTPVTVPANDSAAIKYTLKTIIS